MALFEHTTYIAAYVVAIMAAAFAADMLFWQPKTSHFASERARALTAQAKTAFSEAPPSAPNNYQAFKARVPEADPVLYADFRALWERGQLNPEMVEQML